MAHDDEQTSSIKTLQANNPLHGVTLEKLLNDLVAFYGWHQLGRRIDIRCFTHEPGVASSLKFLRRTPWARAQVEALYVDFLRQEGKPGGTQGSGFVFVY